MRRANESRISNSRRFFVVFICGTALASGGCAPRTDSENVETSGLYAILRVTHQLDNAVSLAASLRVGGPTGTKVSLSGADHWEVNGETFPPQLSHIAPTADNTYNLTFVRSDEQVTTTVIVPASPTILGLTPDKVRYNDRMTIAWDATAPGDQLIISVTGECIKTQSFLPRDSDGTVTTEPIVNSDAAEAPATCPVDVQIARITGFKVNSSFEGGDAQARREAAAAVEYIGTN